MTNSLEVETIIYLAAQRQAIQFAQWLATHRSHEAARDGKDKISELGESKILQLPDEIIHMIAAELCGEVNAEPEPDVSTRPLTQNSEIMRGAERMGLEGMSMRQHRTRHMRKRMHHPWVHLRGLILSCQSMCKTLKPLLDSRAIMRTCTNGQNGWINEVERIDERVIWSRLKVFEVLQCLQHDIFEPAESKRIIQTLEQSINLREIRLISLGQDDWIDRIKPKLFTKHLKLRSVWMPLSLLSKCPNEVLHELHVVTVDVWSHDTLQLPSLSNVTYLRINLPPEHHYSWKPLADLHKLPLLQSLACHGRLGRGGAENLVLEGVSPPNLASVSLSEVQAYSVLAHTGRRLTSINLIDCYFQGQGPDLPLLRSLKVSNRSSILD